MSSEPFERAEIDTSKVCEFKLLIESSINGTATSSPYVIDIEDWELDYSLEQVPLVERAFKTAHRRYVAISKG